VTDQPVLRGLSGHAVITGASGSIGQAVLHRLQDDGYDVVAVDMVEPPRNPGRFLRLDLTDESATRRAARELGDVSVLVNVAGVMERGSITEMPAEDAQAVHEVNVWGAWRMAAALAPGMKARGFGRIINISSVQRLLGTEGYGAYASSKAALDALTRVWARELGPSGVTVNSVAPGFVDAPMIEGLFQRMAAQAGDTPAEARDRLLARVPTGRLIAPEEVANAVSYLASRGAGAVNGTVLPVDGGVTL
jgi:NAD(P)-dependent dehydrogenase (short-subunit alcohol dehydrogenase family)